MKNLLNSLINIFKKDTHNQDSTSLEFESSIEDILLENERKVIESYYISVPCCRIDIVYNPDTHSNVYEVIEPILSEGEQKLIEELKSYLCEFISVNLDTIIEKRKYLEQIVDEFLILYKIELDKNSITKIKYHLIKDSIGYGKIDALINDYRLEDISGDGHGVPVFVYHRTYGSIPTNIVFDKDEADSIVLRLAQMSGRHISLASPLLDSTLPTESRLQASIGSEITSKGSTFTIRIVKSEPITPITLLKYNTLSPEMVAYIWIAVEHGRNILIAGSTASGKTTLLNAMCMFIPFDKKVVSIEDTREIHLFHSNWIPSITKKSEEGGTAIEMEDLLKSALRQRPEYLLIGEVRGREANILFQAMATGHCTYSTLHAESPDAITRRLTNPPIDVPIALLEGIDMVCILGSVKDKNGKISRKCKEISEVKSIDLENEKITYDALFKYDSKNDEFEFKGESEIFLKILDSLAISEEELFEDFALRVELIELMHKKELYSFDDFTNTLIEYYKSPLNAIEHIKKIMI